MGPTVRLIRMRNEARALSALLDNCIVERELDDRDDESNKDLWLKIAVYFQIEYYFFGK